MKGKEYEKAASSWYKRPRKDKYDSEQGLTGRRFVPDHSVSEAGSA